MSAKNGELRLKNGQLERYIGFSWDTWTLPEEWAFFMTEQAFVRNFGQGHLLDCYYNMYSVGCW